VLRGRDPNEVTFEEIAEAAGVSRALVYNYFGDRDTLMTAVYLRNLEDFMAELQAAIDDSMDVDESLAAAVRVHLRYARDDSEAYRQAIGEAVLSHHPELLLARLSGIADAYGGGAEGTLVASATLSMLQATAMLWVERFQDDVTLERAADLMLTMLLAGISGLEALGVRRRQPV
jgi:AcrR family transcriptional regulator